MNIRIRQGGDEYLSLGSTDKGIQNEVDMDIERLISMGLVLVRLTRKVDKTFGGMIFNTYISCILMSTATLYTGLNVFLSDSISMSRYFGTCTALSIVLLSLIRLFYLTNIGQSLETSMKKSLRLLNRVNMENDGSNVKYWKLMSQNMELLKNELNCQSDPPIKPCCVFGLSNGTLVSTFATIITYLIVLIRFKAAENPNGKVCENNI